MLVLLLWWMRQLHRNVLADVASVHDLDRCVVFNGFACGCESRCWCPSHLQGPDGQSRIVSFKVGRRKRIKKTEAYDLHNKSIENSTTKTNGCKLKICCLTSWCWLCSLCVIQGEIISIFALMFAKAQSWCWDCHAPSCQSDHLCDVRTIMGFDCLWNCREGWSFKVVRVAGRYLWCNSGALWWQCGGTRT